MRHFRSILYALVLAPVVWVLVGVGLTHDLTARGRDGFAVESFTGLLLLVLGGAAYGILIFAPMSPAGPFLAGLGFLVVGVWAIEAPSAYAGVWPAGVTKPGFDLSRPGYGLAALLAVPMIVTVLSARRWARYEPPVLPIIGQIGRVRGAVPAPGMPIAVAETAVIPGRPFIGGFATEAERTTVLRVPAETANTTAVVVTSPEEPTAVVDVSAGESTAVVDVSAGESTVVVVEEKKAAEDDATKDVADRPAEDDATEAVVEDEPVAPTEDETATVVTPANGASPATGAATAATAEISTPGAGERTQVLRLPARPVDPDGGGEKTRAIRLPMSAEPTQALTLPAAENGEKTQVIRMPRGPADEERTQVIGPGLVTPPGERTEVAKLPAPGDSTTASIDTVAPPSIAGAERPNFADDPTSRLVPPAPASEEASRTMTVMNLERPPDEIPTQRRPTPDED